MTVLDFYSWPSHEKVSVLDGENSRVVGVIVSDVFPDSGPYEYWGEHDLDVMPSESLENVRENVRRAFREAEA